MVSSLAANKFFDNREVEYDDNVPVKAERNLLAAVLARAICDAFGSAQCERHIVRSAKQWLFGKIDVTVPFSFGWIAVQLDFEPEDLQKNLRSYKNKPAETLQYQMDIV
jgi:hypothetical protein